MTHRDRRTMGGASPLFFLLALLALPFSASGQDQEATADPFTINGVVKDAEDGTPLQYAVVGIPEFGAWAISEADGSYSLEVDGPGIFRFLVVKRGWYLVDQPVTFAGADDLDIVLNKEDTEAPVGPGRLVGRVVEKGSTDPIRNATVRVSPTNQEYSTDSRGRFMISEISSGAILVEVERDGYSTLVDTLAAFPGVTLALDVGLAEEGADPSEASVEVWPRFLEGAGFYRRAERRRGSQFGRVYIEERGAARLSDIIQTVPGIRRATGRFGGSVMTARGSGGDRCVLEPYLDGIRMVRFDIDQYPVGWVEALEVYEGFDVPFEYDNPCGVILIWSRRSE